MHSFDWFKMFENMDVCRQDKIFDKTILNIISNFDIKINVNIKIKI